MSDRAIYRVNEVLEILRIGRTKFYRMVQAGEITIHKLGGSTVVKQESLDRVFATLPAPNAPPDLAGDVAEQTRTTPNYLEHPPYRSEHDR